MMRMQRRQRARGTIAVAAIMLVSCLAASGCRDEANEQHRISSGAHAEANGQPWFEDIAARAGIDFVHDSGHRERYYLPETVCGGGAMIDIDNDGWLDVYIIQSGRIDQPRGDRPPNRLYRNRGDGTFDDVTETSGAGDRGYGMGVATGDINNNGFVDLYITNVGSNTLLQNNGDGTFADRTEPAGVGHEGFGSAAAFFDANLNGMLDLFLVNYLHWTVGTELDCQAADGTSDYCSPGAYQAPSDDVLYHNNGDGTFTDISSDAGITGAAGNGLGIVTGDFTGNGWPDVYVANDLNRNRLWVNRGDGTFEDQALVRGCAIDDDGIEKAGMGVDAVDLFGDGRQDIFVVNLFGQRDSLYRNMGEYFMDSTALVGIAPLTRRYTRFGVGFTDFNHDGRLDVYQANGRIMRQPPWFADDPYAEPNVLLRGTEDNRFEEVLPRGGTAEPLIAASRAAVFGDIDNDGSIDILVVNRDGPAHLLRNIAPKEGNWITVRAIGDEGRDAFGALIEVRAGDRVLRRDVRTAYSYLAANDPRMHFGLGTAEVIDRIAITWPDGERESFGSLDVNQHETLRRGQGTATEESPMAR